MFSKGFKRSGLFGLIGVFVVAAIVVVVVATTTGEGQSSPKTTYALIFGVLAVFLIVLFALQRSDLNRVSSGDAKAVRRVVAGAGGKVDDPTRMPEQQLWASMAVKPIDDAAIKARGSMWGGAAAQPESGDGGDAADLPHRPLDLPLRKLRVAADRRAADRDRGDLRQRPRPDAGQ